MRDYRKVYKVPANPHCQGGIWKLLGCHKAVPSLYEVLDRDNRRESVGKSGPMGASIEYPPQAIAQYDLATHYR